MRRLEFHARAPDEEEVRRWKKQARLLHPVSSALGGNFGWFLIGLASLYVYHSYLNYHSRFAKPTAFINGKALTATNVVLVIDNSGSMKGTEERITQLRQRLQSAGISVAAEKRSDGFGFGVATPRARDNALYFLEEALRQSPGADAVYLFSDFDPTDRPYEPDFSDIAGYARLRELLQQGRRRLYLGTVRTQPGEELIRIAKESGGDVIESK
jgi:hypothetical protein